MTKPPIIEDFAQRQVREYEENKAKLDAARAMLAALSDIVDMRAIMRTDDTRFARFAVDKARAAIVQAKAAGIKLEG